MKKCKELSEVDRLGRGMKIFLLCATLLIVVTVFGAVWYGPQKIKYYKQNFTDVSSTIMSVDYGREIVRAGGILGSDEYRKYIFSINVKINNRVVTIYYQHLDKYGNYSPGQEVLATGTKSFKVLSYRDGSKETEEEIDSIDYIKTK